MDQLALGLEEQEIAAAKTDRAASAGETDEATEAKRKPKRRPLPDTLGRIADHKITRIDDLLPQRCAADAA